ncbi:MAG: hypothetical protein IKM84_06945 [Oscillospiraceae bacterium]|nr:hypothetical protein [Oscillospiraceae bacterium]
MKNEEIEESASPMILKKSRQRHHHSSFLHFASFLHLFLHATHALPTCVKAGRVMLPASAARRNPHRGGHARQPITLKEEIIP